MNKTFVLELVDTFNESIKKACFPNQFYIDYIDYAVISYCNLSLDRFFATEDHCSNMMKPNLDFMKCIIEAN